jgi:hypothetical protein
MERVSFQSLDIRLNGGYILGMLILILELTSLNHLPLRIVFVGRVNLVDLAGSENNKVGLTLPYESVFFLG